MKSVILTIMALSVTLQFVAAFMAIRLIPVSGALSAWILLACASVVMGLRRGLTMFHILTGVSRGDVTAEVFALIISLLMIGGISMIGQVFARIKLSQQELAETHQALIESEIRYRTVADFTSDWEYWLAPDKSFKYISPSCEQISGYTPGEFYRTPQLMVKIIHPEDLPRFQNHIDHLQQSGQPEPIDFRITTRDGVERWISHVCRPVVGADGSPLGQRASNRDITERKRAEEALRRQTVVLEEEVAERQVAQDNLQEKAMLLEEEIEKRQKAQDDLDRLNKLLEHRVQERTAELEEKNAELYKMNRLFVGRELKMVELKERIRELEHADAVKGCSSGIMER